MGRFELKILSTVLLVGIGALIAATLLFKRLVRDALSVGVNRNTVESLTFALDTARKYTHLKRRTFTLIQENLATNPALQRAISDNDTRRVKTFLADYLKKYPSIESISIARRALKAKRYVLFAKVNSSARLPEAGYRRYPFKRELRFTDKPNLRFEIQYVFPESFAKSLGATARWRRTYVTIFDNINAREKLFSERYSTSYILLFSLILVLLTLLSVVVTRRFTRRIASLVDATHKVSRGDLDLKLSSQQDDELGDLISSFNQMVVELRSNRQKIAYLNKISGWQDIARRLAHEIKNPLTPILLATQQLQKKYPGDDPGFKKLLGTSTEIVSEEIDGLRRLVNEFSSFAKLPRVSLTAGDARELIEDFLTRHNQFQEQATVTWRHQQTESLHVEFDKLLLQRVLYNLVENAIQAGSAGDDRPEVEIESRADEQRNWLVIRVSDRGEGVPDDKKEQIFDPYVTTKAMGTGLGLTITKKIVLEHNGRISVADREGGGAVFSVELPLLIRPA